MSEKHSFIDYSELAIPEYHTGKIPVSDSEQVEQNKDHNLGNSNEQEESELPYENLAFPEVHIRK